MPEAETPADEDRAPLEGAEAPEPTPEPAAEAPQQGAPETAAEPPEHGAPEVTPEPAAEAPQQGAPEAAAEPPEHGAPEAAPEPAAEAPEQGGRPAPSNPPQRQRRRRPSAAERHRRTFFAKLSELRRQEQAAVAQPEGEGDDPAGGEPAADGEGGAPDGEAAPAPQPQQPAAPATSPSRSARAQARLAAAIERVGGPEPVLEALQPKRREDGETMKWSSVCCERAQGVKPGDPIFTAWVRLAATPVRDVKAIVSPRGRDDERGPRRGRGGGRRSEGYRGGSGSRPPDGGRGARREELEEHGRDGSFRSSVRIVNVEDSRREREEERRAEREAKRKAEAERIARLGY